MVEWKLKKKAQHEQRLVNFCDTTEEGNSNRDGEELMSCV